MSPKAPNHPEEHKDSWGIDAGFLRRVYRIGILTDTFISGALCFYNLKVAISFAIGGAISLLLLWSLEYVVRKTIVPGQKKPKRGVFLMAFGKYLVIGAAFYFIVKYKWLNIPALAAGIGLVYTVIFFNGFNILLKGLKGRGGGKGEVGREK